MLLHLGFCRSTNRWFVAFTFEFLLQYKPVVRYLYNWVSVAVQTVGSVPLHLGFCRSTNGGSVPLHLGFCRSTNRWFGAFIFGFLSQYKPVVRCLYNWVSVAVQTVGSVPLQMGFCRSTNRLDGRKISSPPGFDSGPSSPVPQSLYRLSYPAHKHT